MIRMTLGVLTTLDTGSLSGGRKREYASQGQARAGTGGPRSQAVLFTPREQLPGHAWRHATGHQTEGVYRTVGEGDYEGGDHIEPFSPETSPNPHRVGTIEEAGVRRGNHNQGRRERDRPGGDLGRRV